MSHHPQAAPKHLAAEYSIADKERAAVRRRALVLAVGLAALGLLSLCPCWSDGGESSVDRQSSGEKVKKGSNVAQWISDTVRPLSIGVPIALYLAGDHYDRDAARHMFNAQGLGQLVVRLLKNATDEPRPRDPHASDGFPSGHAAAAWALATVVADQYSDYKWWAYAWATAATWSRRGARHHTWAQALAGAFIGWGAARIELSSSHGLFLHTDDAGGPDASALLPDAARSLPAGFVSGEWSASLTLWHCRF